MKARYARAAVALATVMGLVSVVACSTIGSAASAAGVEKPNLTVSVVPAIDSAGFFVALHEGLFRTQGLNVKFVPAISSETVIAQQVAGQFDITGGNYVSYIQAQQSHQADLDIIAQGSVMQPGDMGIYTMPGSKIQNLNALAGRTVALNAPRNILYLLAASVLADHGMRPEDVRFVVAKNGFPAMPGELSAGDFNAAIFAEPFGSIADETEGAVQLVDLDQGATTSFPIAGYVVTKSWARKYPRTLAAFYRALEQGQQIADTDRGAVEAAFESLPSPIGLPKATAAMMPMADYPVSSGPPGSVDVAQLQRVANAMERFIGFPSFNIHSMLMSGLTLPQHPPGLVVTASLIMVRSCPVIGCSSASVTGARCSGRPGPITI
jgi:NitT/TauT family transport system substrate-binding protein